jgi:hypothetical protein
MNLACARVGLSWVIGRNSAEVKAKHYPDVR